MTGLRRNECETQALTADSERPIERFLTSSNYERVAQRRVTRTNEEDAVTYKVYIGEPGAEGISPLEKDQWLYKEFTDLDQALGWAQNVRQRGAVPLLIEGDDGTRLDKYAIANALQHREHEVASHT
jgi:hypothetical protein